MATRLRPQDVIASRKDIYRSEIGSTDAESRLILANALADGDADKPALMIDAATLTGAARTALGPERRLCSKSGDDGVGADERQHGVPRPVLAHAALAALREICEQPDRGCHATRRTSASWGVRDGGAVPGAVRSRRARRGCISIPMRENAEAQPGRPVGGGKRWGYGHCLGVCRSASHKPLQHARSVITIIP